MMRDFVRICGLPRWEPVEVLTNQSAKNQLIATEPFWFAYTVFFHALLTADRWLIAGYSFRDACVNDILAQVWTHRKNNPPQILVVAYGDEPKYEEISAAIWGGNRSVAAPTRANLRVYRHGIAVAPNCSTWARWDGAGLGDVAWQLT
ncbi:SIR2-like protein [Kribbella antiqua]|uniref:SIR2-like protein n=2 Tax=Kribbella antiqua TaxID=2512217 RepID=A0A4R2IML9_9ACTN|nr:SIR2-like protein [Kribbella antiqua]